MADDQDYGNDYQDNDELNQELEDDTLNEAQELEAGTNDKGISEPIQQLFRHHPECKLYYMESITPKLHLLAVPPDTQTNLGAPDKNHKSNPWLSIFEKTKLLGFRANQLAQGAKPYIEVPKHIVDTIDIARLELEQQCLPFIISRGMPDGTFEFWRLSQLMIL